MDTKQLLTCVKPIPSASEDNYDKGNKCPAIKVKEEPNDEYNIPPVSASVFNNQSENPNISVKKEIKTESIKQESIPLAVEPIFSSITPAGMNPKSLPTKCGPCNVVLETPEAYYDHFLSKKHDSIVRRGIKVQKNNDNSISATKRPAQENEKLSDPTSFASKKSRPYPQIQEDISTNPINRDPRLKPKDTSKKLTLAEYKEKHKVNGQQLFKKAKNLAEQDFPCPKGLPLPMDLQLQWSKQFDAIISPEIFSQCLQTKCLICNVSTNDVNNPKALSWHYLGQQHLEAVSRIIGVSPKTVARDIRDGTKAAKSLIPGSSTPIKNCEILTPLETFELGWTKNFTQEQPIPKFILDCCFKTTCMLCNVKLTSDISRKQHYFGKKHAKIVASVMRDPTKAQKHRQKTGQWKSFEICQNPPEEATVKTVKPVKPPENSVPPVKISTVRDRNIRLSHECYNFETRKTPCKFCRQYKFICKPYMNQDFHQGQKVTIDYIAKIPKRELQYLKNRKKAKWTTFTTFGYRVFCSHPDVEDFAGPANAFYGTNIECEFTMR